MLAVRCGKIGVLSSDIDRALGKTDTDLEVVFFANLVAVVIVPRLTQRPVDEASLDEAVKVFGETIAMLNQSVSGQRREV